LIQLTEILRKLKSLCDPKAVEGMARFGINPENTYAYSLGGITAIGATYALSDAHLSRAILYGIGATLLSLIIGAYALDILKSLPFFIIAELTGPPYFQLATKAIINTLVRNFLGVTSIALQTTFKNPLLIPFALATLGLAVLAIYLGSTRN